MKKQRLLLPILDMLFSAKRSVVTLFMILVTLFMILMMGKVYGQSDSIVNRYYIIELGSDVDDTTPLNQTPPQRDDFRLLFALKTNLLFDAFTAINLELEIPINQRWSVAGEFIFPWWTINNNNEDSRRNRFQLINGNIEAKYWWESRYARPQPLLTGWFTGVYAGAGTYDFEHNARGYQGDALFLCGISGGYAHTINRDGNLRLEYTIGVGYLTSFYHYYEAEFCANNHWHAVEIRNGRNKWFGPTRAKVSLSWLIDYNIKR